LAGRQPVEGPLEVSRAQRRALAQRHRGHQHLGCTVRHAVGHDQVDGRDRAQRRPGPGRQHRPAGRRDDGAHGVDQPEVVVFVAQEQVARGPPRVTALEHAAQRRARHRFAGVDTGEQQPDLVGGALAAQAVRAEFEGAVGQVERSDPDLRRAKQWAAHRPDRGAFDVGQDGLALG